MLYPYVRTLPDGSHACKPPSTVRTSLSTIPHSSASRFPSSSPTRASNTAEPSTTALQTPADLADWLQRVAERLPSRRRHATSRRSARASSPPHATSVTHSGLSSPPRPADRTRRRRGDEPHQCIRAAPRWQELATRRAPGGRHAHRRAGRRRRARRDRRASRHDAQRPRRRSAARLHRTWLHALLPQGPPAPGLVQPALQQPRPRRTPLRPTHRRLSGQLRTPPRRRRDASCGVRLPQVRMIARELPQRARRPPQKLAERSSRFRREPDARGEVAHELDAVEVIRHSLVEQRAAEGAHGSGR